MRHAVLMLGEAPRAGEAGLRDSSVSLDTLCTLLVNVHDCLSLSGVHNRSLPACYQRPFADSHSFTDVALSRAPLLGHLTKCGHGLLIADTVQQARKQTALPRLACAGVYCITCLPARVERGALALAFILEKSNGDNRQPSAITSRKRKKEKQKVARQQQEQ